MIIEKRIKLKNNFYYIVVETIYKTKENGIISLNLKDFKDDYFDGGDLSLLIEKLEKEYLNTSSRHNTNISFLEDCLFTYERIPFLSKIKDVYIKENDTLPYSIGTITKEELDIFIKENNIKMNFNPNFKLSDARTWY